MTSKKVTVEDLSLQLAGGDAPFALIGPEQNFGPDDWAWQFLRLNHSYQREYANALAQHDPDVDRPEGTFGVPLRRPERKMLVDERFCRKRFGLSTWLDPHSQRLPKLARGESWFFPLTRSADSPEDGTRLVANEGLFSYLEIQFIGRFDRKRAEKAGITVHTYSKPHVWFAVDCSVPPTAQLKSVEFVSRLHRDCLREMNAEMHPRSETLPNLVLLKDSQWFDAKFFDSASAVAEGVDGGKPWCAICINVLDPIKEQIKEQQKKLNQAYLAHCASGTAQPPIRERFRNELTGPRDSDGSTLTDGHFLKALVTCAQLAQSELDEYEMVHFINQHADPSTKGKPQSNSVRDEWVTGLAKRVERYREQARAFVKGGYRWLIHAQKP